MSDIQKKSYGHSSPARCIYCNTILDKKGKENNWFVYMCVNGHKYYTEDEIRYTPEELLTWIEYKNEELKKTIDEIVRNLKEKMDKVLRERWQKDTHF